jgi:hypothetical protein
MAHDPPREERFLQFVARAEEARIRAETATDPVIRAWWEQAAEAWRFLAEQIHPAPKK